MAAMLENLQGLAADHPALIAWLATLAGALLALLVAALAYRLVWTVATRLIENRSFAATVLRFARGAGRTVVLLLVLESVWEAAPEDLPRLATAERLTTLALTMSLVWLGMRCVAGLSEAIIATHPMSRDDNLTARRIQTQTRGVARIAMGIILFIGIALTLMTFPAVRSIGTSLLASAGVAGLVVGLAARPTLSNLIAGLQLALTQPIRFDDVVIVEGEWGRIEEIGGTYVVVRIWDDRRLIVPLQYFLERPFQNWTLSSAQITGTVSVWADYRLPLAPLQAELDRLCRQAPEWDGRVCVLQVTEASERAMQLRALVSSADSSRNWDLRCRIRAGLIAFIQERHPDCLPQARVAMEGNRAGSTEDAEGPGRAP
jgi:small-conductance mechanosensitive channel